MLDPHGTLVQGFIVCTGVVGQIFVAHMNVRGFYFWLASNIALIVVAVAEHTYLVAGLYVYFSAMAVYSIRQWNSKRTQSLGGERPLSTRNAT